MAIEFIDKVYYIEYLPKIKVINVSYVSKSKVKVEYIDKTKPLCFKYWRLI